MARSRVDLVLVMARTFALVMLAGPMSIYRELLDNSDRSSISDVTID